MSARTAPPVLVFAPGARNADLIARRLRAARCEVDVCATVAWFEERLLTTGLDLGAVVTTYAAVREGASAAVEQFQGAEPDWSALPFVLLAPVIDAWLPPWRNTVVLAQPTTAAVLVAAVRRALEARTQQQAVARAADHLTRLAYRDPVTGLPNRSALLEKIRELQGDRRGDGSAFAVMFLDLDDFKGINDRFGHAAGDAALRQVGSYVTSSVRSDDFVARWGGDEFIVLLVGADSAERVEATASRLADGATVTLEEHDEPVRIALSFGVLEDVGPDTDPDDVLKIADARMYDHKAGKQRRAV